MDMHTSCIRTPSYTSPFPTSFPLPYFTNFSTLLNVNVNVSLRLVEANSGRCLNPQGFCIVMSCLHVNMYVCVYVVVGQVYSKVLVELLQWLPYAFDGLCHRYNCLSSV